MNICFQKTYQRAFGTYPLKGETLRAAVAAALDAGYRAFDTAQMYGNEADVGTALAEGGIARDELCIVTKVHPDNYAEAAFLPSVETSLAALRIDQVDLLMLHWPPISGDIAEPLRLLVEAQERGLARHVGVSNFTAAMMREARRLAEAPIVTNQVEFHPLLDQSALLAAAEETGIPLGSYASVARGEIFRYPLFAEIGEGYGKSAAQVALRWILQTGVNINTMSTKPENIRANFDVMDFTLSSIDMARVGAMTKTGYRMLKTGALPWAPVWD
jgi:2,5-diketo-D-gluconate reductase B